MIRDIAEHDLRQAFQWVDSTFFIRGRLGKHNRSYRKHRLPEVHYGPKNRISIPVIIQEIDYGNEGEEIIRESFVDTFSAYHKEHAEQLAMQTYPNHNYWEAL